MKPGIHPEYRPVVFEDVSVNEQWIMSSTIHTDRTIEWINGKTYPYVTVEISNLSHPFFTGTMKIVDTAGRVERFHRRHGRRQRPAR